MLCLDCPQCGILNILQPYRPPPPVTGIALLFTFFGGGVVLIFTRQLQYLGYDIR
jgi:hypothetical protein